MGRAGKKGSLPWAPKWSWTLSSSSFTSQSSFFKRFLSLYYGFQVSLLFLLRTYAADTNFKLMHTSSYATSVQPLAKAKFFWGLPPDLPHTIYGMGPTFCNCPGPPQSYRRPCTIITHAISLFFAPVIPILSFFLQSLLLPAAVASLYHTTSHQEGYCSSTVPGILYQ